MGVGGAGARKERAFLVKTRMRVWLKILLAVQRVYCIHPEEIGFKGLGTIRFTLFHENNVQVNASWWHWSKITRYHGFQTPQNSLICVLPIPTDLPELPWTFFLTLYLRLTTGILNMTAPHVASSSFSGFVVRIKPPAGLRMQVTGGQSLLGKKARARVGVWLMGANKQASVTAGKHN